MFDKKIPLISQVSPSPQNLDRLKGRNCYKRHFLIASIYHPSTSPKSLQGQFTMIMHQMPFHDQILFHKLKLKFESWCPYFTYPSTILKILCFSMSFLIRLIYQFDMNQRCKRSSNPYSNEESSDLHFIPDEGGGGEIYTRRQQNSSSTIFPSLITQTITAIIYN